MQIIFGVCLVRWSCGGECPGSSGSGGSQCGVRAAAVHRAGSIRHWRRRRSSWRNGGTGGCFPFGKGGSARGGGIGAVSLFQAGSGVELGLAMGALEESEAFSAVDVAGGPTFVSFFDGRLERAADGAGESDVGAVRDFGGGAARSEPGAKRAPAAMDEKEEKHAARRYHGGRENAKAEAGARRTKAASRTPHSIERCRWTT